MKLELKSTADLTKNSKCEYPEKTSPQAGFPFSLVLASRAFHAPI